MRRLELFNDKDMDELVEIIYERCVDKDCDVCPRRNEFDGEICMSDIVRDLWRKWKNAVEERDASVDAEPVVHGKWIENEKRLGFFECSCCHCHDRETYPFYKNVWKYCPNCGAKMNEVSENV